MKVRHFFALLLATLLLAATVSGCDSVIDSSPEDEVPSDQAFSSERSAEAVLIGAYSGLQLPGAYGGSSYMIPDFTTTNINFVGSFNTFNQLAVYNTLSTNGSVLDVYDDMYDVINRANEVVTGLEGIDEGVVGPESAGQLQAEAKFIRALMYHNLVRWFAQPYEPDGTNDQLGVPIVTEPTRDPGAVGQPSRNTVAEVYSQISTDLTESVSAFQAFGSPTGEGRATLGSAQALLARVQLYQGQYEEAASLASDVIDSGTFSLAPSIVDAFGSNPSSEDVFAVVNTSADNSGTNDFPSSFYLPLALGGRGDMVVSSDVLSIYDDDDDARQQELIYNVPDPDNPQLNFGVSDATCGSSEVSCWSYKYRSVSFSDNIRVIRLAEVYLIRAEAEARQDDGDTGQVLEDLNTIRSRAGLSEFDSVDDIGDGDDNDSNAGDGTLLGEVLLERRRELAFEGKYRHTLIRTGAPLTNGNTTAPEYQRILPIPSIVLDSNSGLEQNPGY